MLALGQPFLTSEDLKLLLQLRKAGETLAVFFKMAEVNCPDALALNYTLTVMQSHSTQREDCRNGPTFAGKRVWLGTLMSAVPLHSCRWTAA